MLDRVFQSVLLLGFVGLFAASVGCDSAPTVPKREVGTVDLVIDFQSDKKTVSVAIPCSTDSTVFSVLERAQNLGDVKFESRGSGETAFVTSIGGVENLLNAGDNWVYRVNGELGDKSCGLFSVKPGDKVLWVFGKYP